MRAPGRTDARSAGSLGAVLTLAAALLAGCDTGEDGQVTLYHPPAQYLRPVIDRCNAEAGGRYRIVHRTLPRDADGQRAQLVRRLAARDPDPDILGLDVTWVPEFAEAQWLEEWTGNDRAEAERGVLEKPRSTAVWRGKTYAATAGTNVPLLFYDRSLIPEPPRTWAELLATARELKGAGKPYRILFTGAEYEGLVVQYSSIVASAGGRILTADGGTVVMDAGAVRGLEILQEVATSGLTDPALALAREAQVHGAFAAADNPAAFQLNWPDALAATRELNPDRAANLAAAIYPGVYPGRSGKATIGGLNLGVSAYSARKAEAFEAALCLRRAEHQKFAAICGGVPPTIEAIYADEVPIDPCPGADRREWPNMASALPTREMILRALRNAAVRPRTPAYQHLSTITAKVLSPPSGIDPQSTAERLRAELTKAIASRGVLP